MSGEGEYLVTLRSYSTQCVGIPDVWGYALSVCALVPSRLVPAVLVKSRAAEMHDNLQCKPQRREEVGLALLDPTACSFCMSTLMLHRKLQSQVGHPVEGVFPDLQRQVIYGI